MDQWTLNALFAGQGTVGKEVEHISAQGLEEGQVAFLRDVLHPKLSLDDCRKSIV